MPIFAPNIIEHPSTPLIKLFIYIFCVNAIVAEEDCVKKANIVPIVIPFKGDVVFSKKEEINTLLNKENIVFSKTSKLKKIIPKINNKLLNSSWFTSRFLNLIGYKILLMGDASYTKEKDILDKYNLSDINLR